MKKILFSLLALIVAASSASAARPLVALEESFSISHLEITPDGSTIIAAATDGTIRAFAANSGKVKNIIKMPNEISGMALTADGTRLAAACDKLYLIELSNNSVKSFDTSLGRINAMAADRNGTAVITASGSTLTYYSLASGNEIMSFRTPSEIYTIAVDNAAMLVYAAGQDGIIRSYSLTDGSPGREITADIGYIRTLALSSPYIAAGGQNGIKLWEKNTDFSTQMNRHTDEVYSTALTPDGRFAVSGGYDGIPAVWETGTNRTMNTSIETALPITAVAVDPYFRYIVTAGRTPGDAGGILTIQYTSNRNEIRNIYIFRDATLTLNRAGYTDGQGNFGKYLFYEDKGRKFSFTEVANSVHQPSRLEYAMPQPKIAAVAPPSRPTEPEAAFEDTKPPVITVSVRGFAPAEEEDIRVIEGTITDESGVAWAKADDKPLALGDDGGFRLEVADLPSKTVMISAADIYGNTAERLVSLAPAGPTRNDKGRKVALLIGINEYQYFPGLRTPEFGARSLGEVLKKEYGYETYLILGTQATREAILTEINRFRRVLGPDDSMVVYFAGHGERDDTTGNVYWQPVDARPADDTHWIMASQITSLFSAFEAPVLIISDSCYSGAITDNIVAQTKTANLLASGGIEPVTDNGEYGHSAFTGALLKALAEKPAGGSLLFNHLKQNFPADVKQTPQYHALGARADFMLR